MCAVFVRRQPELHKLDLPSVRPYGRLAVLFRHATGFSGGERPASRGIAAPSEELTDRWIHPGQQRTSAEASEAGALLWRAQQPWSER